MSCQPSNFAGVAQTHGEGELPQTHLAEAIFAESVNVPRHVLLLLLQLLQFILPAFLFVLQLLGFGLELLQLPLPALWIRHLQLLHFLLALGEFPFAFPASFIQLFFFLLELLHPLHSSLKATEWKPCQERCWGHR